MSGSWPISWWKYTGRYTEFEDNISSPIMLNIATGEERSGRDLPFGACYDISVDAKDPTKKEDWYPLGADGCSIVCVCPRSEPPDEKNKSHWYIDSRASNCTMVDDKVHRCWVRHGTVGDALHVDKDGNTCKAGTGSIQSGKWHGFLQNGVLHS